MVADVVPFADRVRDEISRYRRTPVVNVEDPLQWWKENEKYFPSLALAARLYLAMPASSAPSERVFSGMNIVVNKARNRLEISKLANLLQVHHNYNEALMLLDPEARKIVRSFTPESERAGLPALAEGLG
jgi:hypothetical protein